MACRDGMSGSDRGLARRNGPGMKRQWSGMAGVVGWDRRGAVSQTGREAGGMGRRYGPGKLQAGSSFGEGRRGAMGGSRDS